MRFSYLAARIFHGYSFVEVEWNLDEPVGPGAIIEVARSEQEHGPFTLRRKVPALDYNFQDPIGKSRGGRHTWYYRLILRRPGKPAIISRVFSDVVFKSEQQESVFAGVLARQMNQLRHRSGVPALLYRCIVDGPVCPACTDASTGQSAGTSRCETCYGTGVEGGYAAPLETFVQKAQPESFSEKKQDSLPTHLDISNVFIGPALPRIYPGDLYFFAGADARYEVQDEIRMPSMLGAHPLEHHFNAKKLPTDSVIYKIPVPEGW